MSKKASEGQCFTGTGLDGGTREYLKFYRLFVAMVQCAFRGTRSRNTLALNEQSIGSETGVNPSRLYRVCSPHYVAQ